MIKILVGINTHFEKDLTTLKQISKQLTKKNLVKKISSVYQLPPGSEFALGCVFVLISEETHPVAFQAHVMKALDGLKKERFSLQILAMEDLVFRTPEFTIPDIQLHNSPNWLVPCAEIWPDYMHPILKKDLRSILNHLEYNEVLFFAQNKSLLDFSSIEK